MRHIDQFAYTNRIRHIDPAYKAGLSLVVLLLCLVLNEIAVGIVATVWMFAIAVCVAGISASTMGRVLLAEGLFLTLTTSGIVISVSLREPITPSGWAWQTGPLWLSSSPAALEYGVLLITRALGAASAMNLLALTTPLVDLIDLCRRLRVPEIIIDLMALMYRFIFTLLETLQRMRIAQESRLGYVNFRRGHDSAGLLGSRLFIDAMQRGRRLQMAMDSRGYQGRFRVLPPIYRRENFWLWLILGVVLSLCITGYLL